MHIKFVTDPQQPLSASGANVAEAPAVSQYTHPDYRTIRRNGREATSDAGSISVVTTKASLAISGRQGVASARIRDSNSGFTESLAVSIPRHQNNGAALQTEWAELAGFASNGGKYA